jgi:hypothetical protein
VGGYLCPPRRALALALHARAHRLRVRHALQPLARALRAVAHVLRDVHRLVVAVEHVQRAAGARRLALQPLERVQDLNLLVAAVEYVADLRALARVSQRCRWQVAWHLLATTMWPWAARMRLPRVRGMLITRSLQELAIRLFYTFLMMQAAAGIACGCVEHAMRTCTATDCPPDH